MAVRQWISYDLIICDWSLFLEGKHYHKMKINTVKSLEMAHYIFIHVIGYLYINKYI